MAMINQLTRRDGRPTPYFVVQPPGLLPHAMAHLQLDYRYPCGPHCRGLTVAPWQGTAAAAVAPMIELDLYGQLALDLAEFAAQPHAQLYPRERAEWRRLYNEIRTHDPEEPTHAGPREGLRKLHWLAIYRRDYWASLPALAPAPPRPNPGMPPA